MSAESLKPGINRRHFIKASIAATATVSVAGASAAILNDKKSPITTKPLLPPIQQPLQLPSNANHEVEELFSRLASVQADNVRLESQLSITKQQLDTKRSSISARERTETESLLDRLEEMNLQVGVLSGLVALYDQLEEIDLDDIFNSGLETVGGALDELVDSIPTVAEGLKMGQAALEELEQQIPLLEDGRDWLNDQIGSMDAYYGVVERSLRRIVEEGGSFMQMLDQWFRGILKWLPFGIGSKAIEVMSALSDLVADIPDTIAGLNTNVVLPLDEWLAKDGDKTTLQSKVIGPVRDGAIEPAAQALANTETLKTIYNEHLVDPTKTKMARKRAIRYSIGEYRETHQL